MKQTVVKIEHFTAVFLYPKERKEVAEMANRNRTNPVQFYLSDDEQYILNTKFKASGMKSMSAFLRKWHKFCRGQALNVSWMSFHIQSSSPPEIEKAEGFSVKKNSRLCNYYFEFSVTFGLSDFIFSFSCVTAKFICISLLIISRNISS